MRKAPHDKRRWLWLGVVVGWFCLTAGLIAAEAAPEAAAEAAAPAEAVAAEAPAEAAFPVVVHGGRLLRLERLEAAVPCVDLEQAIAAGHLEAGSGDSALEALRPPADGHCFAIAVFEIDRSRSLSKVDYRLEVDGQAFDGIAMALGEAAFDPRRQVVAEPGLVRVLFEVPSGAARLNLIPALLTALPMRAVRDIAFAAPATAAEAAPAAAAPPPVAEAAPAETPKADDKAKAAEPAEP
ncbi:MAG: hypothetical protein GX595_01395, partial [Lentisphaerae bacterium]|nr:hypothetical protein [Lentisphaerota bacterium]